MKPCLIKCFEYGTQSLKSISPTYNEHHCYAIKSVNSVSSTFLAKIMAKCSCSSICQMLKAIKITSSESYKLIECW